MNFDILLLNLPDDVERLETMTTQLSNLPYHLTVVSGLKGSLIPDLVCLTLTKNRWSVNHRGTLGCFITHVRAWEIIERSPYPFSLVIEDDVELMDIASLEGLVPPKDTDIIFCNDRTAYPGDIGLRSLSPVVSFVEGHGNAIGGDGYILSPEGARKLLQYVAHDSLFTHVDLRLMAYSIDPTWTNDYNCSGRIADNVKVLQAEYPKKHKLSGFSLFPAVVGHMSTPSRRAAEDKLGERPILF